MSDVRISQRQRIISALKKSRSRGLTSLDLSHYALCYTKRVSELRAKGWKIDSARTDKGYWRYWLSPVNW